MGHRPCQKTEDSVDAALTLVNAVNRQEKGSLNEKDVSACTREFPSHGYEGLQIQCISWIETESRQGKKTEAMLGRGALALGSSVSTYKRGFYGCVYER